MLAAGFGYPALPVTGIVSGLAAAAICLWSWRLDRTAAGLPAAPSRG
jgi:hypothetical protein